MVYLEKILEEAKKGLEETEAKIQPVQKQLDELDHLKRIYQAIIRKAEGGEDDAVTHKISRPKLQKKPNKIE